MHFAWRAKSPRNNDAVDVSLPASSIYGNATAAESRSHIAGMSPLETYVVPSLSIVACRLIASSNAVRYNGSVETAPKARLGHTEPRASVPAIPKRRRRRDTFKSERLPEITAHSPSCISDVMHVFT